MENKETNEEFIKRFMRPCANNIDYYFCKESFDEYLRNKFHNLSGRYLFFYYNDYYPSGGMEDLILRTDDKDGVIDKMKIFDRDDIDNYYFYDLDDNVYTYIKNFLNNIEKDKNYE